MAKIIIRVPEPCHEDWSGMTAAEQGRFCDSCKKVVTDFSAMSDEELFSVLRRGAAGCGRFTDTQLNRVIAGPAPAARRRGWAMILSFLLPLGIWKNGQAQEIRHAKILSTEQPASNSKAVKPPSALSIVRGRITDEAGNPLPDVAIIIKGTNRGVLSDSAGNYMIAVPESDSIVIEASHISYITSVEKLEKINAGMAEIMDMMLKPAPQMLGEVAVVCRPAFRGRLGGYGVVTYTVVDKIIDTVRQSVQSTLKLYPNPAARGSVVTIRIPKNGVYVGELYDSQNRLVLQSTLTVTKTQRTHSLDLPATLAAGAYHYVLVSQTGKRYSVGLIIR